MEIGLFGAVLMSFISQAGECHRCGSGDVSGTFLSEIWALGGVQIFTSTSIILLNY